MINMEHTRQQQEQDAINHPAHYTQGGVVRAEVQTRGGYPKTIIINTKNITKVECINLGDKVTEEK